MIFESIDKRDKGTDIVKDAPNFWGHFYPK